MVGSVYSPHRQVQGERDIDGRSDQYSLGATFYYLLTGRMVIMDQFRSPYPHLVGIRFHPKI